MAVRNSVRSAPVITILSGIAPTTRGGTGRLLRGLIQERHEKQLDVRFVFVGNRANIAGSLVKNQPFALTREVARHYLRRASRAWLLRDRTFVEAPRLLVLHPQEIGVRWLDKLIEHRCTLGLKTEIFLLDASFFCVRSYNHLTNEYAPCLRCLHEGPSAALAIGCKPFPISDQWAFSFIHNLRERATLRQLVFWTQTAGYITLLQAFAGEHIDARVAGLWTDDFEGLEADVPRAEPLADIVYHGTWHEAKGGPWALRLAAALPERRFLFPCRRPTGHAAPANIVFRPMTWDQGLAGQVRSTPLCVVPSLWTAPIEAALVKSIAHAPATATFAPPQSFAASLPAGLVLALPESPNAAAETLRKHSRWEVNAAMRRAWVGDFVAENRGLLERLVRASVS
jgi:hypothetical protein